MEYIICKIKKHVSGWICVLKMKLIDFYYNSPSEISSSAIFLLSVTISSSEIVL